MRSRPSMTDQNQEDLHLFPVTNLSNLKSTGRLDPDCKCDCLNIVSTRWEQKEQFCIISVTRMVCPHQQRLENGTVTILWWLSSVGNCRYRGIGLDDSITFPTEEHEAEKTFPDFPGLFFWFKFVQSFSCIFRSRITP